MRGVKIYSDIQKTNQIQWAVARQLLGLTFASWCPVPRSVRPETRRSGMLTATRAGVRPASNINRRYRAALHPSGRSTVVGPELIANPSRDLGSPGEAELGQDVLDVGLGGAG